MNRGRGTLAATIVILSCDAGCNYTVGDCYPAGQGDGTVDVGGGVVGTPGPGNSGDAPVGQAQSALSESMCNATEQIAPQSPCNEKCEADYADAAAECGKIVSDAGRKTCQDGAYASYRQCRAACADDPVERCKKQCDKTHDACHADCTKNDPTAGCHAKCNDQYASCLKDCEK